MLFFCGVCYVKGYPEIIVFLIQFFKYLSAFGRFHFEKSLELTAIFKDPDYRRSGIRTNADSFLCKYVYG